LRIPKRLEQSLPYQNKTKKNVKKSAKYENSRVAVILEPHEQKVSHLKLQFHPGALKGGSFQTCEYTYKNYTSFAVRNEPKPGLRYPFIRTHLSTYLYANYGHLQIKLFPKRQKNF